VCPKNIRQDIPAESGRVVDAYECVVVLRPDFVEPAFTIDEIVASWQPLQRPLLIGPEPGDALVVLVFRSRLFEACEYALQIEVAAGDLRLLPGPQF